MNVTKEDVLKLVEEKIHNSLYPLKMGGEINEEAFSDLLEIFEESTRIFKNDALIPKKLLGEMSLVSVSIECENYHFKNFFLEDISKKMMHCFRLMIAGISIDERKYS